MRTLNSGWTRRTSTLALALLHSSVLVDFLKEHGLKSLRRISLLFIVATFAAAQNQARIPSIPEIFAAGGVTGRAPETVKWSPDGTHVSYVLRDDSGEHGQLYYVD